MGSKVGLTWEGKDRLARRGVAKVVRGGDAQVMRVNNNLLYTRKSCFSSIQVS